MALSLFDFPLEFKRLLLYLGYSHDWLCMSRRYGDGEVAVETACCSFVYASLHGSAMVSTAMGHPGDRVSVFCENDPLRGLVTALMWMADRGCADAETHYRPLSGYCDGLLTADDITGAS